MNRTTGVLTAHDRLTDAWITLTSGPIIVTPAHLGRHFRVTLTENATLEPPHAPHFGQYVIWRVQQDTTGSRTLTLSSSGFVERQGTVAIDATASAVSFIEAYYDEVAGKWDVTGAFSVSAGLDTLGAAAVGSILYKDVSGWSHLAVGVDGQKLTTHGAGNAPTWET